MCPVCLATAAIIAGSATGSGGLTALVAGTILKRSKMKNFPNKEEAKEVERGNHNSRVKESENCIAR